MAPEGGCQCMLLCFGAKNQMYYKWQAKDLNECIYQGDERDVLVCLA